MNPNDDASCIVGDLSCLAIGLGASLESIVDYQIIGAIANFAIEGGTSGIKERPKDRIGGIAQSSIHVIDVASLISQDHVYVGTTHHCDIKRREGIRTA